MNIEICCGNCDGSDSSVCFNVRSEFYGAQINYKHKCDCFEIRGDYEFKATFNK